MRKNRSHGEVELSSVPPLARRRRLLEWVDGLAPGETLEVHLSDHPLPLLSWLADERLGEFSGSFRRDQRHGWIVRLRK